MLFLFCFCFYQLFEDKATILFHCVGAGWNFFSPWHSRVGVMWRFTRILQEKNELSFGPTVHFCDFVWNYLSCLLGCAEGKTATVRLRQCKTIPNSKLQTSCYKDRFMGVPLMNFMPFGGSPERLVIDHHPERFLEIVRKKRNVFLNTSWKLYHNSFLSLAKQFWPQTKFQTTHNETFLWMTFRQPAYLFATNVMRKPSPFTILYMR